MGLSFIQALKISKINEMIKANKNHLKNFIDVDNYVEKSKKGLLEIMGFKFK